MYSDSLVSDSISTAQIYFLRVKRVLASAVLVIISLLRKGENPQTHSTAAHIGVVMSCSLSTLTNLSLECTLRVIMK